MGVWAVMTQADVEAARRLFSVAMAAPDDLAVQVTYLDLNRKLTIRTVSPIRYLTRSRLLVYCLGREEPRSLYLQRCLRVRLRHVADVLAPEQIGEFIRGRKEASE